MGTGFPHRVYSYSFRDNDPHGWFGETPESIKGIRISEYESNYLGGILMKSKIHIKLLAAASSAFPGAVYNIVVVECTSEYGEELVHVKLPGGAEHFVSVLIRPRPHHNPVVICLQDGVIGPKLCLGAETWR